MYKDIQCPQCGRTVKTGGFFGGRRFKTCVCGYKIDIRADRQEYVAFNCEKCGAPLKTHTGQESYVCPLCKHINDVTRQMRKDGLSEQILTIQYGGEHNMLVWKYPVERIALGSQLLVDATQAAIFYRDGIDLDEYEKGRYTLATEGWVKWVEGAAALPKGVADALNAKVYFVNLAVTLGVKWGTPTRLRIFDPVTGIPLEIGAGGAFDIQVIKPRELLLQAVGQRPDLSADDLIDTNGLFHSMIAAKVKSCLAKAIAAAQTSVLELDAKLESLGEQMLASINQGLEEYGLALKGFYVDRIKWPEEDSNFAATINLMAKKTHKEIENEIIRLEAEGELTKERAETERKMLDSYAKALDMQLQNYTYDQETKRYIFKAAGNASPAAQGAGLGKQALEMGAGLSIMGSVANMMRPITEQIIQLTDKEENTWTCAKCGRQGNKMPFCPECGEKRIVHKKPAAADAGWTCQHCGQTGNTLLFCPKCGMKKDEIDS